MALVQARPEAKKRLYGFNPCRTEAEKRIMASVALVLSWSDALLFSLMVSPRPIASK